jgi:hypothetical protein
LEWEEWRIAVKGILQAEPDLQFTNLALTPKGFLELAKEGVLHPGLLDDKAIADRSKADSLAKFLVCVQAFWMVINVIARKASGLPSTLIELNVVVHVVVTVVVYTLWWNKPLSVQNAVILNLSVGNSDDTEGSLSVQDATEVTCNLSAENSDETHSLLSGRNHNIPSSSIKDGRLRDISTSKEVIQYLMWEMSFLHPWDDQLTHEYLKPSNHESIWSIT